MRKKACEDDVGATYPQLHVLLVVLLGRLEYWGDGVAQLVERRTRGSMTSVTPVRTPLGAPETFVKKKIQVKNVVLTRCRCAHPPCVDARIRMITYARRRSCSLCQSSVDYGNTERSSMHFTDRRINILLYSRSTFK